jgi:hypothetical protein
MHVLLACLLAVVGALPMACTWGAVPDDPRCTNTTYTWDGAYPVCSRYHYFSGRPVPCAGVVKSDACNYGTPHAPPPPQPASWHVHVLFPNPNCSNCSHGFAKDRKGFTMKGAMQLRWRLAHLLNGMVEKITGSEAFAGYVCALRVVWLTASTAIKRSSPCQPHRSRACSHRLRLRHLLHVLHRGWCSWELPQRALYLQRRQVADWRPTRSVDQS